MRLLQVLIKLLDVVSKTRLALSWTQDGRPIVKGEGLAILVVSVGIAILLIGP
jgi:hypothetical protein